MKYTFFAKRGTMYKPGLHYLYIGGWIIPSSDYIVLAHGNISRDGMQSIMYFLKVTHEISEYQYIRINDIILESEKLREVKS